MYRVPRLLAFIPHPDDESYSFGGTLALAAQAGWECFVYCASSGEKGKRHDGGSTARPDVAAQRERELEASCDVLGCRPPTFLRKPDGQLQKTSFGSKLVARICLEMAPDLVLSLGPDGAYGHPDHLAVHRWVSRAWEQCHRSFPLLYAVFPQGLFLPQYEKCLGMMGTPPDPPAEAIGSDSYHYEVDIRGMRPEKLDAIACHRSQLPDGDVEALFPPGIVAELLAWEHFDDASGARSAEVKALLASF